MKTLLFTYETPFRSQLKTNQDKQAAMASAVTTITQNVAGISRRRTSRSDQAGRRGRTPVASARQKYQMAASAPRAAETKPKLIANSKTKRALRVPKRPSRVPEK
jgi:hypothetical protein